MKPTFDYSALCAQFPIVPGFLRCFVTDGGVTASVVYSPDYCQESDMYASDILDVNINLIRHRGIYDGHAVYADLAQDRFVFVPLA